jgi:hypothetical protein
MLGMALKDVTDALELKPNTVAFLRTRGYILLQLLRCSEAEAVLTQSLGGDGEAEYHLALAKGCSAAADPEGSKVQQEESRQWLERSRALGYLPTYERVRP